MQHNFKNCIHAHMPSSLIGHGLFALAIFFLLNSFSACKSVQTQSTIDTPSSIDKEMVNRKEIKDEASIFKLTILQINDVYEMQAISQGKKGGLSRVAALRKKLLQENPNTITIIAGDFFSPSAIGTAKVDGERLNGKQMVDVLNELGIDFATFGNHEFDLGQEDFYKRINEVDFTWISGNVRDTRGQHFRNTVTDSIMNFTLPGGNEVSVGIVGVTLQENNPKYVRIDSPLEVIKNNVAAIKDKTDVLIAITHLDYTDDILIAENIPDIDLILGGHNHENMLFHRGINYTTVAKADANAKSAFVHRLAYNTKKRKLDITSTFVEINENLPDDPEIKTLVDKWMERGFDGFRKSGFEPTNEIGDLPEDFDGLDASVRNKSTNLTRIIANSMVREVQGAVMAIFNSGSIRIDDKLLKGPVTEYDVIRVLPFGGKVFKVAIQGDLLIKTLEEGMKQRGEGGFLQTTKNVIFQGNEWYINGNPIQQNKSHIIAINDFLACGRQNPLEFLNVNDATACGPDQVKGPKDERFKFLESLNDVRKTVITELEISYPKK